MDRKLKKELDEICMAIHKGELNPYQQYLESQTHPACHQNEVYLSDGTVLPLPMGAYELLNRAIISHT